MSTLAYVVEPSTAPQFDFSLLSGPFAKMTLAEDLGGSTTVSIGRGEFSQQYGAGETRQRLLQKGFMLSMSRAGTPTDNGYAERFVGVFKLVVADRRPYHTQGEFLRAAEAWINFYHQERPHEGLENLSPLQFAQQHAWEGIPSLALL